MAEPTLTMATELGLIDRHLREFYDFTGKSVITIGAGGGGILEHARNARFVVAVDKDVTALDRLIQRVRECGLASRFFMFRGDMTSVHFTSDVVLFEFSLHEISASRRALEHARQLAPEIVVMDHAPGSPWSWFAGQERGVEHCWAAVPPAAVRRQQHVEGFQRFADFTEVQTRLMQQGPTSQARIAAFRGMTPIVISMPYRLALLDSASAGFVKHERLGSARTARQLLEVLRGKRGSVGSD
jgi:hypothetical protein